MDSREHGFTLTEVMISGALFALMAAMTLMLFTGSKNAFMDGEARIIVQENLRDTLSYLQEELRKSDEDHVQILHGQGQGNSDLIRFSIPVLCDSSADWLDECDASKEGKLEGCNFACGSYAQGCSDAACTFAEGVDCGETLVAHWGAPLTWKCSSHTCMDSDNNCSTVDYKFIQYGLNGNGKLIRSVLSAGAGVVAQQVLGADLDDLQFTLNGTVVRATITSKEKSITQREMSAETSVDIYLRN